MKYTYCGICWFLLTFYCEAQQPKEKNGTWITLPALLFSPENGFGFGAASLRVFKLNRQDTVSRSSQFRAVALYTTEKQFIFSPRFQFFTLEERLFLTGRFQFLRFPELYYGIGADTPEDNEELVQYNLIAIEKRALKQLVPSFFAGLEFRYYHRFNFDLVDGGLLERSMVPGFNGSKVAGLGPVFLWDKRDNLNNCYYGHYLLTSIFFHGRVLGGQFEYTNYRLDFREYLKLFKDLDHILAFQVLGNFIQGTAPFRQLSALGGSGIMRGYYRGRYRDRHFVAAQLEYRMPIWWRIGAVGFAGLGNVARTLKEINIPDLKYSVGGGVRFSVDKEERLNVRMDWGFGQNTSGFYINIAESF